MTSVLNKKHWTTGFSETEVGIAQEKFTYFAKLRIGVRPSVSGFTGDWYKVVYPQTVSRHQKLVNIVWALF